MKTLQITSRRVGLGAAVRATIHAGLAVAPISRSLKRRIRDCLGCGRRAAALDAAVPNINPFANR